MIKTALKMNIVLFTLLLIVSMPLVYADWSDLTVTVDTNVVTYDEISFIQQYRGLYYIEYIGNKPYIMTDENILYNQYMVTDFIYRPVMVNYEIVDERIYLYPILEGDGNRYLILRFRVDSDQYYILFDSYNIHSIYIYGWYKSSNSFDLIASKRIVEPVMSVYINNVGNYDEIYINVVHDMNSSDFSSFKMDIYKSDNTLEINRPAETYVYEHSDYTRIGAIILDSYNQFVDSLLNPLDTITGWLKDLGNYIWSTIKRIIDPEGIFLK